MIKRSTYKGIIVLYSATIRATKYIRQKLTEFKEEIDNSPKNVGGSNILLSIIEQLGRRSKEK